LAQRKPADGSTHWSTRKIAAEVGTNHVRVTRILAKAGLQPHRLRRYLSSNDPKFEEKAADIIGLYLKPPVNAAVFCVDEKSAIQALDRLDPVLPLSPGRAERHGFEYFRHGTLSLFAALNTQSGEILGKTSARHTSAEFVAFLEQIVASQTPAKEIHIIADNLSAHRTSKVWEFLERNPNVRIHYTPIYSSWLNQVELWFSRIQRDVIARGIFVSLKDLDRIKVVAPRVLSRKAPLGQADIDGRLLISASSLHLDKFFVSARRIRFDVITCSVTLHLSNVHDHVGQIVSPRFA
jgi:transposase